MSHKAEDQTQKKCVFMMKWRVSGTSEVPVKLSSLWGISIDMLGNVLRVLNVYMGECIGKRNAKGRKVLKLCDERELCVANTLSFKADKKKITYSVGNVKQKLILCLWEKNTESIPGM